MSAKRKLIGAVCNVGLDRKRRIGDSGVMASKSRFRSMLRRAALPAAALAVMGFFGAYAIIGPNGMLAYGDYKRQLTKRQKDFAALDKQRGVLRNRVALLDPKHADPDFVDERVRKELNVVHPDEVIFPIKK